MVVHVPNLMGSRLIRHSCRRLVGILAMLFLLLSGTMILEEVLASSVPGTKDLRTHNSKVEIGALQFSAMLTDAPEGLPVLPDLSQPRRVGIPGTASVRLALPVSWSGVFIPPGWHRVELESFTDKDPVLVFVPYGGGEGIKVPAVRGVLDRPARELRFSIAAITGEKNAPPEEAILQLDLRWGILQMTSEGRPVSSFLLEQGRWKLETHSFPIETRLSDRQYLGTFEDPRVSPQVKRCLFIKTSSGKRQLVLMDPSRDRRAAKRQESWDILQKQRRKLRRMTDQEESQERTQLVREIEKSEQMVVALDRVLENLERESLDSPAPLLGSVGPGKSGLSCGLEIGEEGAILEVVCKEGRFRYLISDSL